MAKVKVKIAVAVDHKGGWGACGFMVNPEYEKGDYLEMMSIATEHLEEGEARYWITAELDVPEVKEIKGTVENE